MAERTYRWRGQHTTNNEWRTGLTFEAYMDLMKQEDAADKAAEADLKLAPVVNRAVSDYVKTEGIAADVAPQPESIPTAFKAPAPTNPILSALDSVKAENTSELESVLNNIPDPRTTRPNMQVAESTPTEQPEYTSSKLLEGLPKDLTRDLIAQYQVGTIKPEAFMAAVRKMRQEQNAINNENTKEQFKTDQQLRVEGLKNAGDTATATIAADASKYGADKDLEGTKYAADAQTAREKAKTDAESAYDKRTTILKQPQLAPLADVEYQLLEFTGIGNLVNEKYLGFAKGNLAGVKDFFGLLGADEKAFRSKYNGFKNALIQNRSGSAVTEQELRRIGLELPNLTDSPEAFVSAFNKQLTSLKNLKQSYLQSYKKAKYNLGDWEYDIESTNDYSQGSDGKKDTKGTYNMASKAPPPPNADESLVDEILSGYIKK